MNHRLCCKSVILKAKLLVGLPLCIARAPVEESWVQDFPSSLSCKDSALTAFSCGRHATATLSLNVSPRGEMAHLVRKGV